MPRKDIPMDFRYHITVQHDDGTAKTIYRGNLLPHAMQQFYEYQSTVPRYRPEVWGMTLTDEEQGGKALEGYKFREAAA